MEQPRDVVFDSDAWQEWPHHRDWFNKLNFSMRMGYACGPNGVEPTITGHYVVRPIYNLSGMGVGASKMYLEAGDCRSVPPGYFWCEWFDGDQHSVTYEWKSGWDYVSSWCGYRNETDLSRFTKWVRSDFRPELPAFFDELADVGLINVEFVDSMPIEVHLRPSPDPQNCNQIIPVWADSGITEFTPDYEDADGFLTVPRLGFIIDG